ncbi:MAG: TetR family transcriptional regulator [Steroidobacteraceae bacterium]|jgi:AcrR family transcriptional regulator|nr:TetR family transcriptional regulator [Steroidobacteraceae bacterium]
MDIPASTLPLPALLPADPTDRTRGTRERLLAAALQVLESEGIHALTQTRVAERAALRQSHLTYHFPTRAHLLKAIAEHAADGAPVVLQGDRVLVPLDLAAFKEHLAERVTDARMARVMLALTTASDEDPSLKRWMVEFDDRVRATLARGLELMGHAVAAQELALFHATLVGIAVLHSSEGTEESARRARRLVAIAVDRLVGAALHA